MKTLSTDAANALAGRRVIQAGALRLALPTVRRFWSGVGTLSISGEDFLGVSARALVSPMSTQIGGVSNGVTITLGGLTPEVAASIENEDYHQASAILWRLIFDENGVNLIQAAVMLRGRLDEVTIRETVGGEASIDFALENSGRDLSRRNSAMRSDSMQRIIGGSSDGSFKHVSTAAEQTLYWGKRPTSSPLYNAGKGGSNSGGSGGSGRWYKGREW